MVWTFPVGPMVTLLLLCTLAYYQRSYALETSRRQNDAADAKRARYDHIARLVRHE